MMQLLKKSALMSLGLAVLSASAIKRLGQKIAYFRHQRFHLSCGYSFIFRNFHEVMPSYRTGAGRSHVFNGS